MVAFNMIALFSGASADYNAEFLAPVVKPTRMLRETDQKKKNQIADVIVDSKKNQKNQIAVITDVINDVITKKIIVEQPVTITKKNLDLLAAVNHHLSFHENDLIDHFKPTIRKQLAIRFVEQYFTEQLVELEKNLPVEIVVQKIVLKTAEIILQKINKLIEQLDHQIDHLENQNQIDHQIVVVEKKIEKSVADLKNLATVAETDDDAVNDEIHQITDVTEKKIIKKFLQYLEYLKKFQIHDLTEYLKKFQIHDLTEKTELTEYELTEYELIKKKLTDHQ